MITKHEIEQILIIEKTKTNFYHFVIDNKAFLNITAKLCIVMMPSDLCLSGCVDRHTVYPQYAAQVTVPDICTPSSAS